VSTTLKALHTNAMIYKLQPKGYLV